MSARVLVVDDIPVNVRLLEAKLSAEYYDVITATSGAEALALIKAEPPDIVLLDIMMPEMDGQAFYKEICKLGPYGNRFLFITGGAVTEASLEFEKKWLRKADFCSNPSKQINCVPP